MSTRDLPTIVIAEDSEDWRENLINTLLLVFGEPIRGKIIEFETIEDAASWRSENTERGGDGAPVVYLLDNHAGPWYEGYDFALNILGSRRSEELVVAITSSDHAIFSNEASIQRLRQLGGEFWAKIQEGVFLGFWLADCFKRGVLIPRVQWLNEYGLPVDYPSEAYTDRSQLSWELFVAADRYRKGDEVFTTETFKDYIARYSPIESYRKGKER